MKGHRPVRRRPFRGWNIERDPLDRAGEDLRTNATPPKATARVAPRRICRLHRRDDEERKDNTLNEMVERLDTERSMRIGRSALSWPGGHGWTFKKVRTCTGAGPP